MVKNPIQALTRWMPSYKMNYVGKLRGPMHATRLFQSATLLADSKPQFGHLCLKRIWGSCLKRPTKNEKMFLRFCLFWMAYSKNGIFIHNWIKGYRFVFEFFYLFTRSDCSSFCSLQDTFCMIGLIMKQISQNQ